MDPIRLHFPPIPPARSDANRLPQYRASGPPADGQAGVGPRGGEGLLGTPGPRRFHGPSYLRGCRRALCPFAVGYRFGLRTDRFHLHLEPLQRRIFVASAEPVDTAQLGILPRISLISIGSAVGSPPSLELLIRVRVTHAPYPKIGATSQRQLAFSYPGHQPMMSVCSSASLTFAFQSIVTMAIST